MPDQRRHLRVAVLLDDVDAIVASMKSATASRERDTRAAAGTTMSSPASRPQLIAALADRPVRGAVGDDADLGVSARVDLGRGTSVARRVELARQTIHVACVVVGPLAVLAPLVVAGSAREVRRRIACPAPSDTGCRRRPRPCSGPIRRCAAASPRRAPCRDRAAGRDTGTDPTSRCSSRGPDRSSRRPASAAARPDRTRRAPCCSTRPPTMAAASDAACRRARAARS